MNRITRRILFMFLLILEILMAGKACERESTAEVPTKATTAVTEPTAVPNLKIN